MHLLHQTDLPAKRRDRILEAAREAGFTVQTAGPDSFVLFGDGDRSALEALPEIIRIDDEIPPVHLARREEGAKTSRVRIGEVEFGTGFTVIAGPCAVEDETRLLGIAHCVKDAGADMVGADEYIPKIKDGWTDVDVIIATPDMMGELGRLGRILGPRGLMPNPKVGTVTMDIAKAVQEAKAGRIEYRVDKAGIIHAPVGKRSFAEDKLVENIQTLYRELIRVRPSAVKGTYIRSIFLSGTMTPAIRIEASSLA